MPPTKPDLQFTQSQVQAIADALGHTEEGLTGSEIGQLLREAAVRDADPIATKRIRLLNAFAGSQNTKGHRRNIVQFVRLAMNPARHARAPERYEPMRARLNVALAFCGLAVEASGELVPIEAASTLNEAARRARELREDLLARDIHPDVLACCREEWLADDFFHVVLEATKSINLKIQGRTGLTIEGSDLIDRAFGGELPMLAINAFQTPSHRAEQKGFVNLAKGAFGMFRHPMAHEARVRWAVDKAEAEEVLTLLSFVHRRLDNAHMLPRV